MILFSTLGMVSCSEDEGIVEEYPNWQKTNETFFNELSEMVKNNPDNKQWKRIKCWSKSSETEGVNSDYIIVYVKESAPATETASPLYTDTVSVHYQGNLLPSTSYVVPSVPYQLGYRFDSSYGDVFDAESSVPVEFSIGNASGNSLVDGFATALQSMRRGDNWIVYIPYQLGYGVNAHSAIPAYSTLVFDMRLVDFWE